MRLKVTRAFYGDEKGVKAGDVIDVSEARGRQLVQRKLAVQIADDVSEQSVENGQLSGAPEITQTSTTETVVPEGAAETNLAGEQVDNSSQKVDEASETKQAEQPENKAAAAHNAKAK